MSLDLCQEREAVYARGSADPRQSWPLKAQTIAGVSTWRGRTRLRVARSSGVVKWRPGSYGKQDNQLCIMAQQLVLLATGLTPTP